MTVALAVVTPLMAPRTLDDWAELVRGDLTGAVEGLVAAGRHLTEAKAQHPGTFVAWLESGAVGIGPRHAQRLMVIAGAVSELDATHCVALPAGDSTALYELARLDPTDLEAAIGAGQVTPDMSRKDAKALVARYRTGGGAPKEPRIVPPANGPDTEAVPAQFAAIVIDPPWQYGNTATRGAAQDHYSTMGLEELEALPVAGLASPASHLYLWVTNSSRTLSPQLRRPRPPPIPRQCPALHPSRLGSLGLTARAIGRNPPVNPKSVGRFADHDEVIRTMAAEECSTRQILARLGRAAGRETKLRDYCKRPAIAAATP